jgi:hypothetical protein
MARVRSTARVSREGEETEVTETAPISEVMRPLLKKKILMKMRKIIVF